MEHVLCAHLRQWPIDRLRRRRSELRHESFVLVDNINTRPVIAHVTAELLPGIHPGLSPAEAKARKSGLVCLPVTPAEDLRSLEALGRWLMKFSPSVCVHPPCSLFLDATGLERLFGGLHSLHDRVSEAFAALRIEAGLSIAPTPGAAFALAAYSRNPPPVVLLGQLPQALEHLPPESLRLPEKTVELLKRLGVNSICRLLKLRREALVVRFGAEILHRIDQATGHAQEALVFLEERVPVQAALEFDGAVESLEAIQLAVRQLVERVVEQLTRRGLGAREMRLVCRRPYAEPVEKRVRLTRPCRNSTALVNLLYCALEQLQSGDGFLAMELTVPVSNRRSHGQPMLIGASEERDEEELDRLIERLRARAEHSVEWAALAHSHVPERAFHGVGEKSGREIEPNPVNLFRPLRLLSRPRLLKVMVMPSDARDGKPVSFTDGGIVHRLAHIHGPERITGEWWTGHWKTRDYFDALDNTGARYWLFRVTETGKWYLHGIFE